MKPQIIDSRPVCMLMEPTRTEMPLADLSQMMRGPAYRMAAIKHLLPPGEDGGVIDRPYILVDGVAIIRIRGTLFDDDLVLSFCGWSGYGGLIVQLDAALADSEVVAILFEIDSPGGVAAPGIVELSERIVMARREKPIVAAVKHMALSAAYWIASAADLIVLPRLAEVGSIGVWTMHLDFSGALEQMGIKPSLIFAGSHKIDGHPFGPLPDGVRADWQAEIDDTMTAFVTAVATGRGLTDADVRATEARIFRDSGAVAIRLADEIDTPTGALGALIEATGASAPVVTSQ